ncbi:PAS domain-containing protein [Methanohalophilus mahii]|uniref:histidine kinase n=1 Tax=Methanohalophilus mahii (strain ATCC 35705 / DSM 5219 / SLP) TaxID=547558 RepID=D5EB03_METMS|nr:PAS domain S-box protein [Methanohalophilus mahii]ADE36354.1 PAS/PAC sensor signal transduction histidine kinase [Methanohalophilus mahii DSM 5219]
MQAKLVEEGKIRYMPPEEIAGTLKDKEYIKEMKTIGIIPIKKEDGEVIASFVVSSFNPEGIAEDTKIVLESIASQIGNLILRVKSENELEEKKISLDERAKFLKKLIDTIPGPIFYKDINGVYKGFNKIFCKEILGIPCEKAVNHTLFELAEQIPPELAEIYHEHDMELIKKQRKQVYETKVRCADGENKEFRFYKATYNDRDGNVAGIIGSMLDISDLKAKEKELREEKKKTGECLDAAEVIFVVLDPEGNVLFSNLKTSEILGYPEEEIVGKNWVDNFIPSRNKAHVRQIINEIVSGKEEIVQGYQNPVLNISNKEFVIEWHNSVLRNDKGEITGIIASGIDVTERKLAQKEIRKFKNIVDRANYGSLLLDLDGNITYINDYFANIHGYTPEEVIGKDISIFHNKNQLEETYRFRNKLIEDSDYKHREIWHTHKDGTEFPMLMEAVVHEDKQDSDRYIAATGIDITDMKNTENALRESEAKFRNYINKAPDGVFVADENGDYVEVNTEACETTGYSKEELLSMNLIDLIPPDNHEKVIEGFETLVKKGYVDVEFNFLRKDGSRRWWRVTSTKLSDTRYLGFTKDTTESKLMEEALIKNKLFLNSIIESIKDGVSILDADMNIVRVNDAMNKWYEKNTPLEGKKCYEAYHDRDSPCTPCPVIRCMETGETERNIVQGLPDPEPQWFELLAYPLKDSTTGEITGTVEFVKDITDHKRAEAELAEARLHGREVSKTNSELKANLGHELRTSLGNIIGFTQMLHNNIYGRLNPKQQKHIQGIQKSAEHLMNLIDDILEISDVEAGKMELNIEMFSIIELLNEILIFLKPFAEDRNVEITTDIPEYIPEINVDKAKIKQAIYNLIINAIHFTPEGRNVHISMEYSSYDLKFEVNDSGIGISPTQLEELFRPFKEIYSESGVKPPDSNLGLSLAKEYIELHGGEIEVESESGAGNSFVFTIPIQPF